VVNVAKMGRPEIFTQELADKICESLAKGNSLRKTCRKKGMPERHTVMNWLIDQNKKDFFTQYAQAREFGADVIFDELVELADKCTDPVMSQLLKIRIDTRKWCLARQQPRKYGDKIQQEITGKDGAPIKTQNATITAKMSDKEAAQLYQQMVKNGADNG